MFAGGKIQTIHLSLSNTCLRNKLVPLSITHLPEEFHASNFQGTEFPNVKIKISIITAIEQNAFKCQLLTY